METKISRRSFLKGAAAGGIYGDSYDVSICEGSCQGLASLPKSFQQDNLPLSYVDYDSSACSISYSLAWSSAAQNPAVKLFCEEVNHYSWPYKA